MEVVFFGVSKRSTGEINYMLKECKKLYYDGVKVKFVVNKRNSHLLSSFEGEKIFINPENWYEVFKSVQGEDNISVIVDFAAAVLEGFFDKKEVLSTFLRSSSTFVIVDYFGLLCENEEELKERVSQSYIIMKESSRYFKKTDRVAFVVERLYKTKSGDMLFSLEELPRNVYVAKPVPLNVVNSDIYGTGKVFYYTNLFSEQFDLVANIRENLEENRRKFLVALSSFFSYVFSVDKLSVFFNNLLRRFWEVFPECNSITIIDPIGMSWSDIPGVEIKKVKWLNRGDLLREIRESLFVVGFVPYSCLGTIAIEQGTPFIYVYSSKPTVESKNFSELTGGNLFPRFNALGVLEDEIFFPYLKEGNPYFDFCIGVDLGNDEMRWDRLPLEVEKVQKILQSDSYIEWVNNLNLPTFREVLEFISKSRE